MSDQIPFRSAVLVAAVSGDPIVLAKVIQGVRPQRLVVVSTDEARQRGWQQHAHSVVEVSRSRGLDFTAGFLRLEGKDVQTQAPALVHKVFQTIATFCDASTSEGAIAFDCTTGQGILRILGYDAARRAATASGRPFYVVYCDGDRNQIVFAQPSADGWHVKAQPVRFECSDPATDLKARFAIYGVEAHARRCLFHAGSPLPVPNGQQLSRVFALLRESQEVRWFFNSYYQLLTNWQIQKWRDTALPPDFLSQAIANKIQDVARSVFPHDPARRKSVQSILEKCIRDHLKGDGSTEGWLQSYRADPSLRGLRKRLQTVARPRVLERVAPPKEKRAELERHVAAKIKKLHQDIVASLRKWATAEGEVPQGGASEEERCLFEQEYLGRLESGDAVASILGTQFQAGGAQPAQADGAGQQPRAKFADVFEHCLAQGVLEAIVSASAAELVGGVYQGVELTQKGRPLAEFDTLVLFRTGDLLVFEAKTHRENADRKKIQANTKQFRDCGGVYGRYMLVFPLLGDELEGFARSDLSLIARWQEVGIQDAHQWAQDVQALASAPDAKMIGLDQLNSEMLALVQRWSRLEA